MTVSAAWSTHIRQWDSSLTALLGTTPASAAAAADDDDDKLDVSTTHNTLTITNLHSSMFRTAIAPRACVLQKYFSASFKTKNVNRPILTGLCKIGLEMRRLLVITAANSNKLALMLVTKTLKGVQTVSFFRKSSLRTDRQTDRQTPYGRFCNFTKQLIKRFWYAGRLYHHRRLLRISSIKIRIKIIHSKLIIHYNNWIKQNAIS